MFSFIFIKLFCLKEEVNYAVDNTLTIHFIKLHDIAEYSKHCRRYFNSIERKRDAEKT